MGVIFTPTGGNDTAALQAIIDGFGSNGGKITVSGGSGCGLGILDLSNTGPLWIDGDGKGVTKFVSLSPNVPVFRTAPGTDKRKLKFSNFTVTKSVPRTGGAYFDFGGALRHSVFEDLELEWHFNGIAMPFFEENKLNRIDIVKPSGAGDAITLGVYGTPGSGSNISISETFIRGNDPDTQDAPAGSRGIVAYDINALATNRVDIGGMKDGNLTVQPKFAAKDFFLHRLISDATQQGHGVLVHGEGVKTQWTISDGWFCSAGKIPGGNPDWARESCGILLAGPGAFGTALIDGNRIFNNNGSAIRCTISNRLQIVANSIEANGLVGVSHRYGLTFDPAVPSGAPMIVANDFVGNGSGPYFFGPNAQNQFLEANRV